MDEQYDIEKLLAEARGLLGYLPDEYRRTHEGDLDNCVEFARDDYEAASGIGQIINAIREDIAYHLIPKDQLLQLAPRLSFNQRTRLLRLLMSAHYWDLDDERDFPWAEIRAAAAMPDIPLDKWGSVAQQILNPKAGGKKNSRP